MCPSASPSSQSVEIREIYDPADASATFEFFEQDLVQLHSRMTLKASRVMVRLQGCALVYYSTNVRVRTRPTLYEDRVAVVSCGPQSVGTANGLPLRPAALLFLPPGQRLAMVAEPGYESVTFLIQSSELMRQLEARGIDRGLLATRELEWLEVGSSQSEDLFSWGKRLLDAAVEQPSLFNDSQERRAAAQQELLDLLCSTLSATSKMTLDRRDRTRQAKSDVVKAAEHYALNNTEDHLYIKDLCRATGVSERTLEYAFREVMGLSPTAYLTRIRLHKVREALLRASPETATVTEVALQWGFWHFGEFAKAYKSCFHELPSETLRRS